MVTGCRDTTTDATQWLYLLNDPFVLRQSLALAERLLRRVEPDDSGRIDRVYRRTLGRQATPTEIERAQRYLGQYQSAVREVIATSLPPHQSRRSDPATLVEGKVAGKDAPKKPAPPQNPDQVVQVEAPVEEEVIQRPTPGPLPGPASARRFSAAPSSVMSSD